MDLSHGIEDFPVICISDNPDDKPASFKYIRESIPGPGSDADSFQYGYCGCSCLDNCSTDCLCTQRTGLNYDKTQCLITETCGSYDKPVMECNNQCLCGEQCCNRLVQRGIQLKLQVFATANKGWGVRSVNQIRKFSFVCEYAGEVLGHNEALTRLSLLQDYDNNYIIVVKEHVGNGKEIETVIDPTYYGNIGRFINHSCEPNLMMILVRVDCIVPKLCFFSSRDIAPFEELCYDYSGKFFSRQLENSENQSVMYNDRCVKKCMCGSSSCRGTLPYDPEILE